jgi:hypothetical protein
MNVVGSMGRSAGFLAMKSSFVDIFINARAINSIQLCVTKSGIVVSSRNKIMSHNFSSRCLVGLQDAVKVTASLDESALPSLDVVGIRTGSAEV